MKQAKFRGNLAHFTREQKLITFPTRRERKIIYY